MTALVDVKQLAVRIGSHEALSDVTFSLDAGSSLGLVGETGSGKSLTCRALIGLLPRIGARVMSGTASFNGIDLVDLPEARWRPLRGRQIGFVPQSSIGGLDPVMRVGNQLEEAVRHIDPAAETRARALELLDQVRLADPRNLLKRYPHELSGGMRQRVMIALALVGRPKLLIADEPTTALDVTVQRGILDLLGTLKRETGLALILVAHDLAVVSAVCDRVTILYSGMTVESGSVDTVFQLPAHPYTHALLAARPNLASLTGGRLVSIPGSPPALDERPPGCPFAPRCEHALDECAEVVPPLTEIGPDHWAACIRAGEF